MSPAKAKIGGLTGIIALVGILLFGLCSSGCGKSALELSSDTLDLAHDMQEEGVNVVTAQLREELARECGEITERVDKLECGSVVGERYASRETATGASAETIDGASFALWSWARSVAAKEADEERPPVAVCEALSRVVALIDDWAAVRGSELPIEPWSCPGYEPGESETESAAEESAGRASANRSPPNWQRGRVRSQVPNVRVVAEAAIVDALPELTRPWLGLGSASPNGFVRNAADDGTKEEGDENLVVHASLLPSPSACAEVMS